MRFLVVSCVFFLASLSVLWPAPVSGSSALPARRVIGLQPLGSVSTMAVREVARALESMFDVRVELLDPRPLPSRAFYRARGRYRGDKILMDLESRTPARYRKVVGLMSRDLSVTKGARYDWGVIGVAGLSRRAAVVSLYRLDRRHASPERAARRLGRVAIHELGHTFGIPHCRSAACVMTDAHGTVAAVDRSSGRFCGRCQKRLGSLLRS